MSTKLFDPVPLFQDLRNEEDKQAAHFGDRRDGKVYGYSPELVLAINVALATGRPLLLRGHAGSGKSSVAYNVARVLGRCYFEQVVTSTMEARDLLWRFDAVRRLGDAQVRGAAGAGQGGEKAREQWKSYYPYIEPGVLWWMFDAESAARRGLPDDQALTFAEAKPPVIYRPTEATPLSKAVLLLDEIDKAEPDVPNNLLVALGSMQFRVDEIETTIAFAHSGDGPAGPDDLPLVVITTNEERQLPPAFLRRCVVFRFKEPEDEALIDIANKTEGEQRGDRKELYANIAKAMRKLASNETGGQLSVAEYLDAVRACLRLEAIHDEKQIMGIVERTTWKHPSRE